MVGTFVVKSRQYGYLSADALEEVYRLIARLGDDVMSVHIVERWRSAGEDPKASVIGSVALSMPVLRKTAKRLSKRLLHTVSPNLEFDKDKVEEEDEEDF